MSIDTAFDPTRPQTETPRAASSSLKEEPIPHLDLDQPYDEGASIPEDTGNSLLDAARSFTGALNPEQIAERATAIDKQVRGLVEKHPLGALAVAAVAGFFIGRIVTRI